MEKESSRKDIMPQLIEAARAGTAFDEIARRVREYYFPDDTDHDPMQGIRMRDKVSRDVAEWICQMGETVDHIQMEKDIAKENSNSQSD